jgi:integrase
MPVIKFTVRAVQSIEPTPGKQVEYWDAGRSGFGLRVTAGGCMTWVLRYRHHQIHRRLKLGTYPAMKLADAREEADAQKREVEKGGDPFADRMRLKTAKTFQDLATEYIERHAKPKKKTWREDQRVLDRDVLPKWRHLRPDEIRRPDVRQLVESVADRGSPIQANRHLAIIRKIFNFAIERDWLEYNPCHMVKRPGKERPRDRVLTPQEIRRFWAATETEAPPIRAAFRLRLLTAQRGGEILNMRWSDVDLETKWWVIPAEFAKNGLSHRVPLSAQAVGILEDLRAWLELRVKEINEGRAKKHLEPKESSDWVFPSRWYADEPLEWTRKATGRLKELSDLDFRPHDLRRTAASLMTSTGTPRVVVQKILNHVETGVTAVYDRYSYDNEKRVALDAWGRQVAAIVCDEEASSKLLAFRQVVGRLQPRAQQQQDTRRRQSH